MHNYVENKLVQQHVNAENTDSTIQIDHAAITYKNHEEIMNVQIKRGVNIDSDHYFKRVKIRQPPKRMC